MQKNFISLGKCTLGKLKNTSKSMNIKMDDTYDFSVSTKSKSLFTFFRDFLVGLWGLVGQGDLDLGLTIYSSIIVSGNPTS